MPINIRPLELLAYGDKTGDAEATYDDADFQTVMWKIEQDMMPRYEHTTNGIVTHHHPPVVDVHIFQHDGRVRAVVQFDTYEQDDYTTQLRRER